MTAYAPDRHHRPWLPSSFVQRYGIMTGPGVSDLHVLPLPAFWIDPPYHMLERAELTSVEAGNLRRGVILALDIEEPERDTALLSEWTPVLRGRLPAHPLVLRLSAVPERAAVELGRVAAELRIRGLIVDGEEVDVTLRRTLTEPHHLAGDVVAWLSLVSPDLSDFASFVVERIFAGALQHQSLTEILPALGLGSESKIRMRFRDERLPPPREWRHLAAATYSALRLQRFPPGVSLEKHAHDQGYSERGTLIRQLRSVFRASPRAVRRTLGWEPWVSRWLARRRREGYFPDWSGSSSE